jgi:hypothetical protein
MDPPNAVMAPTLDPSEVVRQQYHTCLQNLTPTSRNRLAKHLSETTGLSPKEALEVVDRYCDEENLPIPAYLSREFAVGWLKVIAVMFVVVAGMVLWYGRSLHMQKIHPWGLWCIGAILCGLAVLFWLKSLELEAANARADREPAR